MSRFSFVVTYDDGVVEDFTSNDGDTAEQILKHVETFLTETIPGSWDRLTILSEDKVMPPTPLPSRQGFGFEASNPSHQQSQ